MQARHLSNGGGWGVLGQNFGRVGTQLGLGGKTRNGLYLMLRLIRTIFEIMKEIRISQKSERDSHRFAAFHVEMISVCSFPNQHFRTGSIQVKGTVTL